MKEGNQESKGWLMGKQERQQEQEDTSKEDRLMRYLESEIVLDPDRAQEHKRMSAEGCAAAAAWLIAKTVKRQEEINKAILLESVAVKRLTWGVFILTAAVVGLTIVLVVKG